MNTFLKILHVFAAMMLLGNLLMAPFWRKRMAIIMGGPQARAVANRTVRVADLMVTLPGWVVTLITGLIVAINGGFFKNQGWLHVSMVLFLLWVVLWHVGVLRARKAMISKADEAAASGQTPADLERYERQWAQWSYVSAAVAIVVLILMISQPF
jgi:uncharacterized membrane protein